MPAPADPSTEAPVPRLAASVLLLRATGAQVEVLLLRRQPHLRFLGGYWVFPGGVLDEQDWCGTVPAPSDRVAMLDAAAVAACRELSEEVGLSVSPKELRYFARWITPATLPRRYDTYFFIGQAPRDPEITLAMDESCAYQWCAAMPWVGATDTHGLAMTAPTLLLLRELAERLAAAGSVTDLVAAPDQAGAVPPVLPKMRDSDVRGEVVLPWDDGYAALPGEGIDWDAPARLHRSHWPSRLAARSES